MSKETPRIVCGTDFSRNAQDAGLVAAALAAALRARLDLIYIDQDTTRLGLTDAEREKAFAPARRQLRLEADRMRAHGIEVTETLRLEPLADRALVNFIAEQPTALAVVSSVSKTTFTRWTVGSVSEFVAENAPCPTLVVRNPAVLLTWLRASGALRIFAAIDFTATSDAVLRWLGGFRTLGHCQVALGHVNWPPDDARRLGEPESRSLTANSPAVQRSLQAELQRKAEAVPRFGEFRTCVAPSWGRADAALVLLATQDQADLIVVGTHQRHGLVRTTRGSISEGVLRHSTANVVCVPSAVAPATPSIPVNRRVVVATDFSPLGNAAVPHAYTGLLAGSEVRLIHVLPPVAKARSVLPSRTSGAEARTRSRNREVRAALAKLVPAGLTERGIITECVLVHHRSPAAGIVEEAERFGADLICLGSHGRGSLTETVLGSVARGVLTTTRRPVLIVRPPPE